MPRVRPPAELTEELNDIWRLVVGYTKQEATAPLRGIGPFMRYGAVGMLCFAVGTLFGTLAIVRLLQTQTGGWLDDYLSFVPYLTATIACGIVGALAARSVARTPWKSEQKEGDGK